MNNSYKSVNDKFLLNFFIYLKDFFSILFVALKTAYKKWKINSSNGC